MFESKPYTPPKDLWHPAVKLLLYNDGVVLAGGALRKIHDSQDEVCDYDFFFTSAQGFEMAKKMIGIFKWECIFKCPLGELLSYKDADGVKFQLIKKRLYSDPIDLIESFDFVPCCAAFDGETFYYHTKFKHCVVVKELMLNKFEYPVASLKRMAKYSKKGYFMTKGFLIDVIEELKDIELDDKNTALYID